MNLSFHPSRHVPLLYFGKQDTFFPKGNRFLRAAMLRMQNDPEHLFKVLIVPYTYKEPDPSQIIVRKLKEMRIAEEQMEITEKGSSEYRGVTVRLTRAQLDEIAALDIVSTIMYKQRQ